MGFFKDLLLGSKPSTQQATLPTLSPGQEELSKVFREFIKTGGGPVSGTVQPFTGDLSAPAPAATTTSLAALEDLAKQFATGTGVGQTQQVAQETLERLLSTGATDSTEFFNTSVRDPLLEFFDEDIIPGIGRRFSGSFFGSDRMGAERDATETLIETLGREKARISFEAEESAKNRQIEALKQVSNITGIPVQVLGQIISAAEIGRQPDRERVAGEKGEFIRQQDAATEKARLILSFLGQTQQENIISVLGGTQGIVGPALSAFAGNQ